MLVEFAGHQMWIIDKNTMPLYNYITIPMSPFSMALMSGLSRQSVGGRTPFMPPSSSFSCMANVEKA